eukprot:CAMPEP_0204446018 /NCGR_PEP_ID=MMETSP0470-20130426/93984_1 /ASSEMBLY_ACC=CAM_ASM_000385 /TAXON_ID=2969 /ORGANISM="Oxyrrhis marina" /LENGTH=107 /DNA_ID=CAMNT_0051445551 /DNA_START=113 /DNA_END=432 /DNA_ORIENTATION=+
MPTTLLRHAGDQPLHRLEDLVVQDEEWAAGGSIAELGHVAVDSDEVLGVGSWLPLDLRPTLQQASHRVIPAHLWRKLLRVVLVKRVGLPRVYPREHIVQRQRVVQRG